MKKTLLVLTVLMSLSGFASLQAKVGWKRAWACRNGDRYNPDPRTLQRLKANKCTGEEMRAGEDLHAAIIVGGAVGAAVTGGLAALAADIATTRQLEREANVERLERQGRAGLKNRPENPLHQSKE